MKKIIPILLLFGSIQYSITAQAQHNLILKDAATTETKKNHEIIFQFSTSDTLAQKALMKQLNNILNESPNTKIEVVCHGPGLVMLVKNKTTVYNSLQQMHRRGVWFVACEFSMSERNVTKEEIITEAGFVKGGIIEIVDKQEKGWSYIKSGF